VIERLDAQTLAGDAEPIHRVAERRRVEPRRSSDIDVVVGHVCCIIAAPTPFFVASGFNVHGVGPGRASRGA
jgi:hypothetical protein